MKAFEQLNALGIRCEPNADGAKLTSFGSGGRVDLVAYPSEEQTHQTIEVLRECGVSFRVIGGGSNLLLPDEGYSGALIRLSRLSALSVRYGVITAGAGVKLPLLALKAAQESLSGLEFCCGIPAEVGGAVCTNAGAFGQALSDTLVGVKLLTPNGVEDQTLQSGYHCSNLPQGCVVLAATFALNKGQRDQILSKMRFMTERRRLTQPRERSAGSVFRRVGQIPAAVYIEKTGLKGLRVGGAELSTKHCNFIVNKGGATTQDYFAVAEHVKQRVLESCSVVLEYEVERLCSPKKV